ncbi:hypothetical protein F183_A29710 [Bryobacterales bacterium F-183]|nr:hypothetical protein F183_A29710 [Bryobacterales bacterium F-183]
MKLPQDLRKLIAAGEAELTLRAKIETAIADVQREIAKLSEDRETAITQIAEVEAMRALGETTAEPASLALFDELGRTLSVRLQGLQTRLRMCDDNLAAMESTVNERAESFWREEVAKLQAEWREAAERLGACVVRIAALNSALGFGRLVDAAEAEFRSPANADERVEMRQQVYDEESKRWTSLDWQSLPAAQALGKGLEPLTDLRWRLKYRNEPKAVAPAEAQTEVESVPLDERMRRRGWSIFGNAA